MRGAILRSLQRTCMTHLASSAQESTCPVLGLGTRHVVQQARSLADAQPEHRPAATDAANSEPEGSSHDSAAGKAKAAADWAAKGAGSVVSAAKTAVTGSNEASEDQTPAGKMQTRRNAHGQDDDTHERIGDVHDAVKDKWQDERPISERYPSMKKAAEKQHRTGGSDSTENDANTAGP